DVWRLAHHVSPAHGALSGHLPARLGLFDADDLGDDITGAVDGHACPDVDAFLVDLRLVVHGHVADGHSSHHYWLHVRDRREHAGAAHVARDVLDLGLRLLRGVLERDRPARRAGDEPQLQLLREPVDLDHHAVDLVWQLVPAALPLRVILHDLVDGIQAAAILVDAKAHRLERVQHVPLRLGRARGIERVHEGLQVAARGHAGADLAHTAGGRVARVDEAPLARGFHL